MNQRGSLMMVMFIIMLGASILYSFLLIAMTRLIREQDRFWETFSAQATAQSAFAVMEVALERRSWEPPPDAQCLRSLRFSATTTTSGGQAITVNAKYNPQSNSYSMTAQYAAI